MMCEPATRGIYIDLICGMHELDQSGKITGTLAQLSRLARCTEQEMVSALKNLTETNAANVTERNGKITVENRRMSRDYKFREGNNLRQKKHRSNGEITAMSRECHAPSSSSSSSSSSTSVKEALLPNGNNGAEAPVLEVDGDAFLEDKIWKDGLRLLLAKGGKAERTERAFLGKLVKDHGREKLAEAISRAYAMNVPDPKSYIVACLQERQKKSHTQLMEEYARLDAKWVAEAEASQKHLEQTQAHKRLGDASARTGGRDDYGLDRGLGPGEDSAYGLRDPLQEVDDGYDEGDSGWEEIA